MGWFKPRGRVHKTLCDGLLEEYIVFPLLREGKTQAYISCPCCAFWRGTIFGGAVAGILAAVLVGVVAWTR